MESAKVSIASFEEADSRSFEILVAGPGALLVAKLHKIHERSESPDRLADKDALDAFRILRAVSTATLGANVRVLLADDRSSQVTDEAIRYLQELFGSPKAQGSQMAARALVLLENPT